MPSKVFSSKKVCLAAAMKLAVLSSALLLIVVLGCQQASPIPAEIVGDSMAPLLCGQRNSQVCPRCEIAFNYGVSQHLKTLNCPNCGNQFLPASKLIQADRVEVVPNQSPRRWDIIAFEHDEKKKLVKRVIGLPGETVSISDGEIFVGDELIQKPDHIIQQTKRQVFDSEFSCPQVLSALFFDADFWDNEDVVLIHPAAVGEEFDWISYRHRRKYSNRGKSQSFEFPPIRDDDGFNQSLSRRLNVVTDLIVQIDLTLAANSEFRMMRAIAGKTYQVTLTVDENSQDCKICLSFNDSELSFRRPCLRVSEMEIPMTVLLSNIDRNIKLVVNGETIVEVDEPVANSDKETGQEKDQPFFKFGFSRKSSGRVNRCRIWRDIHYFVERGAPKFLLPMTLGANEYFVVGDNVPVSRDSRHFGQVVNIIGTIDPLSRN